MFKDSTLLQTYFVEISVSKGYQSYFWWVVAAVCSHQSNAVEQSLLDPSDRSRQLRMQSLFTSHTITLRRHSIFSLLAFTSLWWSPKNGILCKAFFFLRIRSVQTPCNNAPIRHISRIFPSTKSPHNYCKIYDTTSRKIWFSLTWRHSPLLDPDSLLCWLSVKFIGHGRRGNFKARFRGENKAESKNSVIYGL